MTASLKIYGQTTSWSVPQLKPPYSLVCFLMGLLSCFWCEVVLALEIQLPSLRVALCDGLTQDEQIRRHFQELYSLEEVHLHAVQDLDLYQQNMARPYSTDGISLDRRSLTGYVRMMTTFDRTAPSLSLLFSTACSSRVFTSAICFSSLLALTHCELTTSF